jgi:translation initiation factor 1
LESECSCPPPVREAKPIPPNEQTARLTTERRAKGKLVTVIAGLYPEANDLNELGTRLKNACGAGGTVKDARIELQGDHLQAAEKVLQESGYKTKAGRG